MALNEKDVQHIVRRAFFDAMTELMDSEPDRSVDWLVKLHEELAWRFSKLLPTRISSIEEHMDTELFAQQLRAGTYGSEQLGPLIEFTWGLLRMACAPDMDTDIQQAYDEVAAALQPGAKFSTVVPLYLRHAHHLLDMIMRRIMELK